VARALSDLQKWMLVRALENSESDLCKSITVHAIPGYCSGGTHEPAHLRRSEIRAGYYKFAVECPAGWRGKEREWLRAYGRFVKSDHPNYAAVNLAITRAHVRLIKRGLATNQVGFYLTNKGREQARLLVNKPIGSPDGRAITRVANKVIGSPQRPWALGVVNKQALEESTIER